MHDYPTDSMLTDPQYRQDERDEQPDTLDDEDLLEDED